MDTSPPPASLSEDEIRKWQKSHKENERAIERLTEENRAIEKRLGAAEILFPHLFGAIPTVVGGEELETWPELVEFALQDASGGRTQAYMLKIGRQTSMADKIKSTPAGLYNAVARMVGRGQIIRNGELFYLPNLWAKIQSGEIEDDGQAEESDGRNLASEFIAVLSDGRARTPKDIFDDVTNSETRQKLKLNPNYGYTVLGRLLGRGELSRTDGYYRIMNKEAPSSDAAGASDAEEVAASSDETSPLFRVVK